MRSRVGFALLFSACVPKLPQLGDPCAEYPEPGLYQHDIDTPEGASRKVFVYVPSGVGPRDLVVALHGSAESATDFSAVTQFISASEQEGGGYVSIFPQGRGFLFNSWNAGDCCGSSDEANNDVDDVDFLDQAVREISPLVCGDRVFATGFSNGAMMAHRWACESTRVDAAMPASGPLLRASCKGAPLPVRHIHGLADTRVPFEGGPGDGPGGNVYPSAESTMDLWKERNLCTADAPTVLVTGSTTCTSWVCAASTTLCTIEGWDHRWPGGIHSEALEINATTDGVAWFQSTATQAEVE